MKTKDEITKLLAGISDPEIPVLSIIDLGIIRDVKFEGDLLVVDLTPTYSACPAIETIKQDITSAFIESGIKNFELHIVHSPAWTTEWMSDDAIRKLKEYGIAPPSKFNNEIISEDEAVTCPFCNSENTILKSFFGSTACKSMYYCNNCSQPFEHFKRF